VAYQFGDGFDLYAAPLDAVNGFWDTTAVTSYIMAAGRFTGSRALQWNSGGGAALTKTSGVNDAVHHLVVAFSQGAALTGTNAGLYLQLLDGATGQCAVVFRSDGSILLTSGTASGTTLATYSGAVTTINTWYAFEFEVVIHNSTGRFRVRKNGNTSDDFDSGAVLDTQNSANAYANKLQINQFAGVNSQTLDDLLWRSDASSVAWLGDIRCYTRMPASDSAVQFSRVPTSNTQTPFTASGTIAITAGTARYTPFTAAYDGTIGTATITLIAGYTGNMKCSLFASSGSAPTTVLGSATTLTNPVTGLNTFTFGTPVSVTKGTAYWIGFDSDTTSGTWQPGTGTAGMTSVTAYAAFPAASPATSSGQNPMFTSLTKAVTTNATVVNEAQEDGLTSYVYDSTAGHADLYGIATIASTPASTIAVTTRAYMQKSDAGSRTAAVQIKSGGTTVASPTLTLTTSGWQWAWATYTTDPNTSAAWAAAAVDNCTIGPKVIA
jgi:hypothetical protein